MLAGCTGGSVDSQPHAGGEWDLLVMKFSNAGVWQWTRLRGSTASDVVYGLVLDSNNSIIVAGYTLGSMDGHSSQGSSDLVVSKYDSSGNWLWTDQRGTSAGETAYAVAVDASDNIYPYGSTTGSWPGYSNAGSDDVFLVKLTSSGSHVWSKQLGSSASDLGNCMDLESWPASG